MGIRRLFYVGSMQPPEDCAGNPWGSEALNVTQLTLMQAFSSCGVEEVIGLSFPGSSAWHSTRRFKRSKRSVMGPGIEIRELPFLALGPLQPISQAVSFAWHLARLLRQSKPDVILISNPITRFSLPALLASRLWDIPVVIIASDLTPVIDGQSPVRRVRQRLQQQMARSAPGVVVFSSHLGRELRVRRPWLRMVRPPASDLLALPESAPDPQTRIIYYAGTMAEVAGADLFLQAITYLPNPEYRFWFSGRGPLDDAIREAARGDTRITHWGFVSREHYRELLQKANILVNPRPSRLPENRYNFPSKLMEYMAAGRPIISTATSDVAEHYGDAVVLLEDETPEGLARCIEEVFKRPPEALAALSRRARDYALQETWEAQARRILDFAKGLRR
ncbi:MAG: hypothetical protein Kow0063_26030 [Anaerolineae bacterium]